MPDASFPGIDLDAVCRIGQRHSVKVVRKRLTEYKKQWGPRGGDHGLIQLCRNDGRILCFDWTMEKELYVVATSRQREVWLEFHSKVLVMKAKEGSPRASMSAQTLGRHFPGLTADEICKVVRDQFVSGFIESDGPSHPKCFLQRRPFPRGGEKRS